MNATEAEELITKNIHLFSAQSLRDASPITPQALINPLVQYHSI